MSNDAAKELRARLRKEAQAINERNRVPGDLYYKEPVPRTPAATREEWYQGDEAAQAQEAANILRPHRLPEQPALTEAEAQLVIGAIPLRALPGEAGLEGGLCSHSDKEWRLSDVNPTDVKCDHDYIAIATTRKHAKQIVTDHACAALVPGLIAALVAFEPYLSTEAELLDYASLNEGRASGYDTASMKARRALAAARKAGI